MEDLYSELSLEKIENKPTGIWGQRLDDYTDMFKESKYEKFRSKKILLKGDPGMGKTTFSKKIGWDWARKIFELYRVVFVVFLKLVRPEKAIENVILSQYPVLEGLGVSKEKLRFFLENYGKDILLILDGLDEHALGENKDVMKIILGQKLVHCNILLTSRPHTTRTVEHYFRTIVSVKGFTFSEAEKFTSRIVTDKDKVKEILRFNPTGVKDEIPLHTCPILLSFICLLVREDDIDLTDQTMPTGEIHTRMVRCLYKKFTIRKGLEFKSDEFEQVLLKVGKLALHTLLTGDPLLQRSKVISEEGEHAFDYGLLIGHEDFRLIRDETADIFITFPHRSLQEFLGAFFFVLALARGEPFERYLGKDREKPLFMMNPLFLKFCLWLLFDSQKYFTIRNTKTVCSMLQNYICAEISRFGPTELNLPEMVAQYLALMVDDACVRNDSIGLQFFEGNVEAFSQLIISENRAQQNTRLDSHCHPFSVRINQIRANEGRFEHYYLV